MNRFLLLPLRKQMRIAALLSVIVHGSTILIHWYVVSPIGFGGVVLLQLAIFLLMPLALVILAVPMSVLLLPFREFRRDALNSLCCASIYVLIGIQLALLTSPVRIHGFRRLALRSRPLVAAIQEFVTHDGRPPVTLEELVPRCLAKVPNTGMPAYPTYQYSTDMKRWGGNPWVIYVECPSGGINFDMFVYFPKQNYPATGYGGSLERVGDWAYVHE